MHAKLTEIIGINKVNINPRYPALNAIFSLIFPIIISLFWEDSQLYFNLPGWWVIKISQIAAGFLHLSDPVSPVWPAQAA